ncbi:MAG: THUMP-like domain-containing protein [Bacteroidota bacterium]
MDTIAGDEMQRFLIAHEHESVEVLALSGKGVGNIPMPVIANQLKCRQKARHKLPTWHRTRGIVYPPSQNLEQSSSETTARFKLQLARELNAHRIADLTAGFGVDSFFFSQVAAVDAIEPNSDLAGVAQHNLGLLGATVRYHPTTAEAFLTDTANSFDLVFIDPSRRSSQQQRVVRLAACEPDVTQLQTAIFGKAKYLLVKASPLLDIQQGVRELAGVKSVYVVAVDNEVKELLFLCERGYADEPTIHAINLGAHEQAPFVFSFSEERAANATYSSPLAFVLEPHAALLKAGAFKTLAQRYRLQKLAPHTHLYTCSHPLENFPGRVFQILEQVKPDKKLSQQFPEGRVNILTRNYPLTVEQLKQKTGLKEGGTLFLIGCSGVKEKYLMVALRMPHTQS